jgi:hypothetical protein
MPIPNNSTPCPITPICEFTFSIPNWGTWESKIDFNILEASVTDDKLIINVISINGTVYKGNYVAERDDFYKSYPFQLIFELWHFDVSQDEFQFHDRFVSLWLLVKF